MSKQIIDKLFDSNKSFKREDFLEFISDLTWKYPENIKKSISEDKDWNKYSKEEIEVYEDKSWDKIAIMIYKMPTSSKVEKARSNQRNLISTYLKNEWVYNDVDSVLVAFYSENNPDWRLSFVKQEFKYDKETKKILNELTPAKRYSFLVDSNSKNITVKQRLTELLKWNKSISDIEEAFSVEKVSKEFFDKYVKLYEKLTSAFEKDLVFQKIESESNHWDEHFNENFVKKLLWQIVFLYFLQKKGWLWVKEDQKWWTWNKTFMQDLLDECLRWWDNKKELWGKNFFNDYLEHLFYDNLNLKRDNDFSEYFGYKIPYLNWGLFEPMNGYEWKGLDYVILAWEENNLLFKEIFDTFDEYNFTVYENDPLEQDVAVDPEMLGKVFENLLPENERKGKWAFYTPREIVHYMCKESLKNHIINKTWINEEKINWLFERKDSMYNNKKFWKELSESERYEQFWEYIDYAWDIVKSLKEVKIVDPAVGSGAFPMGLLKEIVSLRKYLQENILLEDNVSEYQIKKETLENCIYWVDLDPWAVEIAKLRFWLSLVIEEDSGDKIDPLPNLDYKIMQWNSLIEDVVVWDTVIKLDLENNTKKLTKKEEKDFSKTTQWTMSLFADEEVRDDILKRLKFLHKIFFQEKDNNKKKTLKKEIDHIEKELIRISWEVEVNKLQTQIENIEWKYILSWMAWDEKDAKKVATWQSTIASIKEMEEKYKRDNIRSFFPWKLHFWEVFNENWGFDIVIGNPPYVNAIVNWKNLILRNIIKNKLWYKTLFEKWDLYVAFIEKWFNILSPMWNISYIIPNTYLKVKYAKLSREYFSENSTILRINNLENIKVFESASVKNIIFHYWKKILNDFIPQKILHWNRFNDYNNINKETQKKLWVNVFNFNESYEKLKFSNTLDLNEIVYISKWMVLNACEKKAKWEFIKKDLINDKYTDIFNRKYVEWKLVKNYYIEKIKYLEWGTERSPSKISRPTFSELYEKPKILWWRMTWAIVDYNKLLSDQTNVILVKWSDLSDISNKSILSSIKKEFKPNDINLYRKTLEKQSTNFSLKYILSIINSSFSWYFFKSIKENEIWLIPNEMKQLPIKQISEEEQKPFVDLVEQILEITKNEDYLERDDLKWKVKDLESRIDDMVYELYGLTKEEIELVEESLR